MVIEFNYSMFYHFQPNEMILQNNYKSETVRRMNKKDLRVKNSRIFFIVVVICANKKQIVLI